MLSRIGAICAVAFFASGVAAAQAGDTASRSNSLQETQAFTLNRVFLHEGASPSRALSDLLASLEPAPELTKETSFENTAYTLEAALREFAWRHRVAYELQALLK